MAKVLITIHGVKASIILMPSIYALMFGTIVVNTYSSYTCWAAKPTSCVLAFASNATRYSPTSKSIRSLFLPHKTSSSIVNGLGVVLLGDRKSSGNGTSTCFCPWSCIVGEKAMTFYARDDN
jgi:hypothetical protein